MLPSMVYDYVRGGAFCFAPTFPLPLALHLLHVSKWGTKPSLGSFTQPLAHTPPPAPRALVRHPLPA